MIFFAHLFAIAVALGIVVLTVAAGWAAVDTFRNAVRPKNHYPRIDSGPFLGALALSVATLLGLAFLGIFLLGGYGVIVNTEEW